MQYKNVITGIVISETHYIQMDAVDKVNWMAVADEPEEEDLPTEAWEVKDDDGGGTILAPEPTTVEMDSPDLSGDTDLGRTDSGSSDFGGFDGGDTGGGGASSDF